MNNKNDLLTGTVWKKLFIFFLPIAAGTCIQQLYNAADGLIVGRFVGTAALAAVGGSAAQLVAFIVNTFVSLTSGAAVIVAQLFGAGKLEDVKKASGNAYAICTGLGLILGVVFIIITPWMLGLMKTPPETMADSVIYMRIYFIGLPLILLLNMESGVLRAVGDSRSPFVYMIIACLSNIVMDIVFVVVFKWAVMGVAIATVLAQVINATLLTRKLIKIDAPWSMRRETLSLKCAHTDSMLRIGIPASLQSMAYSVSNMIVQVAVNSLGTLVVASWAMSGKVDGIFWSVTSAVGAAITTFVGQNYGAGRMDRIHDCVKQGFIMAQIFTIALSAAIMLLAYPVLGILTADADVIETTFRIMTFLVPFYFIWTIIETFSGVLRGAGDAVVPVMITGIGIALFRVIWVTTVFRYMGNLESLCICYPVSWAITGIAMFVRYKRGRWQKLGRWSGHHTV